MANPESPNNGGDKPRFKKMLGRLFKKRSKDSTKLAPQEQSHISTPSHVMRNDQPFAQRAVQASTNQSQDISGVSARLRAEDSPQYTPGTEAASGRYVSYQDEYAKSEQQQQERHQHQQNEDSDNHDDQQDSNKSAAPTLNTTGDAAGSDGGQSKSVTTNTMGADNSIFSSSNHSQRSLSTTLTSFAPTHAQPVHTPGQASGVSGQGGHSTQPSQASTYFTHQYPTPPASAVPPHMQQSQVLQPHTYRTATANNLLSDDASILTLASSSHQNLRRRSVDTNASTRAIPPTSTFGGSRESLPLSVLSLANEQYTNSNTPTPSIGGGALAQTSSNRPSIGFASAERASVYSSSGMALTHERNSQQARAGSTYDRTSIRGAGDGSSIRSGMLGHGRSDSVGGGEMLSGSPLPSTKLADTADY